MAHLPFSTPGIGAAIFSQDNQFIWGGPRAEIIDMEYQIDNATRDTGSNNPQILRPGLAMGKVTATGKLKQFDNTATDGTQNLIGFLKTEVSLIDTFGVARDAFAPVVVKAPVKAKNVLIGGVTLIGHAAESAIRTKIRVRFLLDDDF